MSDGPIEFDIEELEKIEVVTEATDPEEAPADEPEGSRRGSRRGRRRSTSDRRSSSGGRSSSSSRSFRKRIEGMLVIVGTVISGLDAFDGQVIIEAAPQLAEQLDNLAKESPRVRRFIEAALETGAWSGVIGVLGMNVIAPIAVHHRLLPEPVNTQAAQLLGVPVREPRSKPEPEPDLSNVVGLDPDREPKL